MDLDLVRACMRLARIQKPAGGILIFWPYAWAITLAATRTGMPPLLHAALIVKFLIGSFIHRSMGCTINDIVDRDLDGLVERTKSRPIPKGDISVTAAYVFFVIQLAVYAAFLHSLGTPASLIGALSIFPLTTMYPYMKRITNLPQAWLAIAANWGFPVAWLTVIKRPDYQVIVPFMLASFCWTMIYDTIYAYQDKEDDKKIGIGSTALLFGDNYRVALWCFAAVEVAALTAAGVLNHYGKVYFVVSVGSAAVHIAWQLWTVDPSDKRSCAANLMRNCELGGVIWLGMLLENYFTLAAA